jgi:homeobox protein cut-like
MGLMSPDAQLSSLLLGGASADAGGADASAAAATAAAAGGSPGSPHGARGVRFALDEPGAGGSSSLHHPKPAPSFSDGDPASMVAILRGQRDRFRGRMLELEAEAQGRARELADARSASARVTSDNVKLYEKIRYLQSFAAGGGGGGGGSGGGGGGGDEEAAFDGAGSRGLRSRGAGVGAAAGGGGDDDFEGPYKRMYAETIDPFADFNRRERARQYGRLTPAEQLTLTGSRFFLGNRHARNFLFIYVLVMHALVFATLWHFAHVRHAGCGDVHDDHGGGGDGAAGDGGGDGVDRSPGITRLLPTRFRGGAAAAVVGGGVGAA